MANYCNNLKRIFSLDKTLLKEHGKKKKKDQKESLFPTIIIFSRAGTWPHSLPLYNWAMKNKTTVESRKRSITRKFLMATWQRWTPVCVQTWGITPPLKSNQHILYIILYILWQKVAVRGIYGTQEPFVGSIMILVTLSSTYQAPLHEPLWPHFTDEAGGEV